jgi:hypothetical protein
VLDELAAKPSPGMQGFIPLIFHASLDQRASYFQTANSPSCFGKLHSHGGVIANLVRSDKEPDLTTIGVCDGLQLDIHATPGSVNQTAFLIAGLPFSDIRLAAVLCALISVASI